ncbi:MAG TPA: zinc-ribbon domain-containing protein [Solirubrobacteraceae bacterium]|nr:zinc-ribbon domain-containing protein [Solirubrobacteraceae bacterium]
MFLFFLFGLSTRIKTLGSGEQRRCPRCQNVATWTRLRESTQLSLFFVPVLRWGRSEFEACPICGTRAESAGGRDRVRHRGARVPQVAVRR